MRSFYVYGFRSRSEYTEKSSRSYDDERRRIESWLGDYMQFRQRPDDQTDRPAAVPGVLGKGRQVPPQGSVWPLREHPEPRANRKLQGV